MKKYRLYMLFFVLVVLGIVGSGYGNWPAEQGSLAGRGVEQLAGGRHPEGLAVQVPQIIVRTPSVNIHYRIEQARVEDVIRVELWYTRGTNGRWQLYACDEDRMSPVRFVAPGEGVYRFLVVAVDRWERRSIDGPGGLRQGGVGYLDSETPGQVVVLLDYTRPRLFLHSPRGDIADFQQKKLQIWWEGFDANLRGKPVELYYQRPSSNNWNLIHRELPAGDRYDWELPEGLSGPIIVKAVLTDLAGNQDVQLSGRVNITSNVPARPVAPVEPTVTPMIDPIVAQGEKQAGLLPSDVKEAPVSAERQQQAIQAFRRGLLHSQRFEWEQATVAYEAALESDPQCIGARVNLANALSRLCRFEEALGQYQLCLDQNPDRSTALFGLAQAQIALRELESAQNTLAKLLERDRRDWQAWLIRGNVAEQLGNKTVALDSWDQAAKGDLPSVARQARQRIERYQP